MSTDTDTPATNTSWRHQIAVDRWAQACHDTKSEYFEARVQNMTSQQHLRAAPNVEVSRDEPRPERVGLLNRRLAAIDSR